MKITAQEEYGLRILIRIAGCKDAEGMSIPQLSEAEGISSHYVAKLTRMLRMEGFINSRPGNKGGYILADNVLWSGNVIKPIESGDYDTKALMDFNDKVSNDPAVENVLLPVRDGIMLIRKK